MGLDMYFTKHIYVKNWEHTPDNLKHGITVKQGGKVRKDINAKKISNIVEDVAYWRKFNALHNWFVEHCADGVDDCKQMYVDRSKIEELVDTLRKVKVSLDKSGKKVVQVETGWRNGEKEFGDMEVYADTKVADELFPTASGFFFGGTEYDKYYYDELVETLKTFEDLLSEDGNADYYYQASW